MLAKQTFRVFLAAGVLGLVIAFNIFGLLTWAKSLIFNVTAPVVKLVTVETLRLKASFSTLLTLRQQLDENRNLHAQVKALQLRNAELAVTVAENRDLRQMLSIKQNLPYTAVSAEVVSRDLTGLVNAVVIDRGSDFGFSPGNAVLDSSGALLGVINEVYSGTSKFTLLTDGSVKVDARIPGRSALGVVSGSHGLGLSLDLISHETALQRGDPVVTSGLSGTLPAGILIGSVEIDTGSGSNLFQSLGVNPAADFKDFIFVMVVTAF